VDRALCLVEMLQQDGHVRVSEAAERLGVARSTAHRLLAMLVYRGFAIQDTSGVYNQGPMAGMSRRHPDPESAMRETVSSYLQVLVANVEETANLQILIGTHVKFIATVECKRVLRVGDRTGRVLPAHLSSGGKAMLAALEIPTVIDLFQKSDVNMVALQRELIRVRRQGFALNDQLTEPGLSAVGVVILGPTKGPTASLTIAIPSARFHRNRLEDLVLALQSTAAEIQREISQSRH